MIEIELPKDITKYEAKLAGVATPRQAICVGIAAGIGYIVRAACITAGHEDMATPVMTFTAAIPLLFAVYKPYNMNLEDFLEQAFVGNVLAPAKRKYQIENEYAKEYEQILKEEHEVIGAYNRVYGIKVPPRRINDPKDKPRQNINHLNPELTGYL